MKCRDILKRLVTLADRGKLTDEIVHHMLNGLVINDAYIYRDGNLVDSSGVRALSPDKILSIRKGELLEKP